MVSQDQILSIFSLIVYLIMNCCSGLEQVRVTADMFNIPGHVPTESQLIVTKEYELPSKSSQNAPNYSQARSRQHTIYPGSHLLVPSIPPSTPDPRFRDRWSQSKNHDSSYRPKQNSFESLKLTDQSRARSNYNNRKLSKTTRIASANPNQQPAQNPWLNRDELTSKLMNNTNNGELLLLFCSEREKSFVKTVCRGKAKDWILEFVDELKWPLEFHTTGVLDIGQDMGARRLPSLVYAVGEATNIFPHDLNKIDRRTLYEWLTGIYETQTEYLSDQDLEDLVLNEHSDNRQPRWLIYVQQDCDNRTHSEPACRPSWWQRLARSTISDNIDKDEQLETGYVNLDSNDLNSETWIVLRYQLPQTYDMSTGRFCEVIYLNAGSHYTCLQLAKSISGLRAQASNPARHYSLLPMSDVQKAYRMSERRAEYRHFNQQYLILGVIGGLAVIVLAVSIFWGLSSSSFAEKTTAKH